MDVVCCVVIGDMVEIVFDEFYVVFRMVFSCLNVFVLFLIGNYDSYVLLCVYLLLFEGVMFDFV